MTRLQKPVRRVTDDTFRGRALIVELAPPFIISIREKGRRRAFTLTVRGAYDYAIKLEAERIRREKHAAKTAKKEE